MKPMVYGSVCSGIESASVAWEPLGWRPAFFSEIDAAPRAVLKHHWPDVPLHGDFTTIKKGQYEPIQLLVGGTPCQDFSIAGLRKGITGDRGNLSLEFIKLVDRLRPGWVVWENVPGVLSIDGGKAFGAFLGGLGECGYGFAYRVLDAQYYGVAQRRRRVFVVGCLGNWRASAAVLFERESLSGNPAPSRETGERVAATLTQSSKKSGGIGMSNQELFSQNGGNLVYEDVAHTLRGEGFDASEDGTGRGTPLVTFDRQSASEYGDSDIASTLNTRDYKSATDLIVFDSHGSSVQVSDGDYSPTLRAMSNNKSHLNGGGQIAVAFDTHQITSKANRSNPKHGDPCHTLHAQAAPVISLDLRNALRDPEKHDSQNCQGVGIGDNLRHTITAGQQGGVATSSSIRRLTPRECERLQGFPDDHTLTPITLKPRQSRVRYQSDSARYKMIGNSKAVPVIRKIGERIDLIRKLMGEE